MDLEKAKGFLRETDDLGFRIALLKPETDAPGNLTPHEWFNALGRRIEAFPNASDEGNGTTRARFTFETDKKEADEVNLELTTNYIEAYDKTRDLLGHPQPRITVMITAEWSYKNRIYQEQATNFGLTTLKRECVRLWALNDGMYDSLLSELGLLEESVSAAEAKPSGMRLIN